MTNLSCSNRLSAFLQDEIARESCALRFLVIAVLTLCCATLRAQSTPTVSLSVLSAQSMGAISVKASSLASAPVIVRSELSESERQASLDFSIPLKMRNLPELQERVAHGGIISTEEMMARYYPAIEDYQAVVDWVAAQGFNVEPQAEFNLSVFA